MYVSENDKVWTVASRCGHLYVYNACVMLHCAHSLRRMGSLLMRMCHSNSDDCGCTMCVFWVTSEQRPAPFHEDFSTAIVTLRVITITKSDYDTFIIFQEVNNSKGSVRNGCGSPRIHRRNQIGHAHLALSPPFHVQGRSRKKYHRPV